MIKVLKPNNNHIHCSVTDVLTFGKIVKDKINAIAPTDIFLSSDNREIALIVFKRLLVEAIDEQVTLNENEGYIVHITIDNQPLLFSCSLINNDKIGKGYTIALTLQD